MKPSKFVMNRVVCLLLMKLFCKLGLLLKLFCIFVIVPMKKFIKILGFQQEFFYVSLFCELFIKHASHQHIYYYSSFPPLCWSSCVEAPTMQLHHWLLFNFHFLLVIFKVFFHCFCLASSIGVAWTTPFFWHHIFFMSFSFYIIKW